MRLLVDTQAFLWWVSDDVRLTRAARRAVENGQCFLSIASCWEMAIKVSLKKLILPHPIERFLHQQLEENEFTLLAVSLEHVSAVASLPFLHRDPFDRLLVAQAAAENLHIVSSDEQFDAYDVKRIW